MNIINKVMASLDVESLFTNVPLNKVIDTISDYGATNSIKVGIPLVDLCKLISICTKNIQFLFNGRYYHRIEGVAMGSSLGPVLADIFMAHLEQRASNIITKVSFHKRCVGDIFAVCESAEGIQDAREALNVIHPNIKFTSELESANCSPFLDVLLTRRDDGSIQWSIYRKKTRKCQYIHFKSFAPISHKRGLVRTLFERARKLCSEYVIDKGFVKLHEILR